MEDTSQDIGPWGTLTSHFYLLSLWTTVSPDAFLLDVCSSTEHISSHPLPELQLHFD